MLIKYKKEYEKTVMGLLSLMPDFKNLQNLREEMALYNNQDSSFQVFLYSEERQSDIVGAVGLNVSDQVVAIRYLVLAPGSRTEENERNFVLELQDYFDKQAITALPAYVYLLQYLD
jgi:riboflavin biosynthesis RibT protein